MAELLDVIKLKDGTEGTVVEVFKDGYYVEISDRNGRTTDFLVVKPEEIEAVVWKYLDNRGG